MNKSYRVSLSDDVMFDTKTCRSCGAHVETPEENLTGKTFPLGRRSTKLIGANMAVMYDVVGVMNGRYPAHLTVFFGPAEYAKLY